MQRAKIKRQKENLPDEVMAAAQEFCDEKLVTLPRWMV